MLKILKELFKKKPEFAVAPIMDTIEIEPETAIRVSTWKKVKNEPEIEIEPEIEPEIIPEPKRPGWKKRVK